MCVCGEEISGGKVITNNKGKEQVQYLGYNDGTCSELVIFSTFMLELGDYSVPTALTGEEEDYYYIIMNLIWELPMRGRSSEYLIRNPLLMRQGISDCRQTWCWVLYPAPFFF
jgi:hypothetical protein